MKMRFSAAFLAFGLSSGVLAAACGGGGGETPPPKTPDTSPSAAASAIPSAAASGTPSATPSASAAVAPSASASAPPAPVAMQPIMKSELLDKLKEAGLDPKKLPKLSQVERSKIGKVMNTFTKALGYKCMDCHTDDFKAWTPKKRVAEYMWDHYVAALAMDDGAPVYCDSCHQGRAKLLDHHDKKAVGTFMQANFVNKLKRGDKKDHDCATCHGEPFEGDILKAVEAKQ